MSDEVSIATSEQVRSVVHLHDAGARNLRGATDLLFQLSDAYRTRTRGARAKLIYRDPVLHALVGTMAEHAGLDAVGFPTVAGYQDLEAHAQMVLERLRAGPRQRKPKGLRVADWRRAMKAADMASIHHVAYALNAAARGIIHEWLNSRMESPYHHTAAQLFIAQGFYLAEFPCEPRRVRGYVRQVLSELRTGRIPAIPSPEPSRESA